MDAVTVGTMQGLSPDVATLLVEIKNNVKLAQTLGACGFAVCLWDTLAYLHVEYSVVWKAKWSFIKASYLFTRYITLLAGILYFIGFFASFTQTSCGNYVKLFPAMGILPLLGCTFIMTARAYNLWGNHRILLGTMLVFSLVQLVGQLVVALLQTVPVPVGNGIKACMPTTESAVFVIYWLLPTLIHAFLAIITCMKAWELAAVNHRSPGVGTVTSLSRCYQVIFPRFGLVFPITIVIVEIVQIIFYLVASDMQRAILSPLSGFLISVLACQMVLIYRLTNSSGTSGLSFQGSQNTGLGNSTSKILNPPIPAYRTSMGRFGGVQAFVTSHQTIDDEKDVYGPKSMTTNPHVYAANNQSSEVMNKPSTASISHLFDNTPTPSSGKVKIGKRDQTDEDSLFEVELKRPNNGRRGV